MLETKLSYSKTCSKPALLPFKSLPDEPTKILLPLSLSETEIPKLSPLADPFKSAPIWVHELPFHCHTSTSPNQNLEPTATIFPSPLKETDDPCLSPLA